MDQNTWLQNFLTEDGVKPEVNKIENVKISHYFGIFLKDSFVIKKVV